MTQELQIDAILGSASEEETEARIMPSYLRYRDGLFRRERKHSLQYVPSPDPLLEAPIVDTHAHVGMLYDPALTLARCGYQGMDFVCCITDPAEMGDAEATYDNVCEWRSSAFYLLPDLFNASRTFLDDYREEMRAKNTPLPQDLTADEIMSYRCGCTARVPEIRVASGVHPHNAESYDGVMEERLLSYLANPLTGAIGEIGLDYYYDISPREVQRDVFRRQIQLAHMTGLPVILHMRDAHDDGFRILEEEGWPEAGVLLHCCSVGPEELKRWIERDCYVAFGGAVTFSRSEDLRESAKIVPVNRLLTETDSPYMAPVPFRGIENGPEFTVYIGEYLAELRGVEPGLARKEFLWQLHDNAHGLLKRDLTGWQNCYGA